MWNFEREYGFGVHVVSYDAATQSTSRLAALYIMHHPPELGKKTNIGRRIKLATIKLANKMRTKHKSLRFLTDTDRDY